MDTVPGIASQDVVLGAISALLFTATLYLLSRKRWDNELEEGWRRKPSSERFSTLYGLPDRRANPFSFLGSLFAHLLVVAAIPALNELLPERLPFQQLPYDLVIVEYKTRGSKLPPVPPPDRPKPEQRQPSPDDIQVPVDPSVARELAAGPEKTDPEPATEDPGGAPEADIAIQREDVINIVLEERPDDPAVAELGSAPEFVMEMPREALEQMEGIATLLNRRPTIPRKAGETENDPLATSADQITIEGLELARRGRAPIGLDAPAPDGLGGSADQGFGDDPVAQALGTAQAAHLRGILEGLEGEFGGARITIARGNQESSVPVGIAGLSGAGAGTNTADGLGSGVQVVRGDQGGAGGVRPLPRHRYGIILVSDASARLPEARDVLKGNPIYTVYITVPGSRRKWVLQFCLSEEDAKQYSFDGQVVQVLPGGSVRPPYAEKKEQLDLSGVARQGFGIDKVVVYTKVDKEGHMADSRVIRGGDPELNRSVLANLQQWDFLPAFRNGQPVAVEAVLGIPIQQ